LAPQGVGGVGVGVDGGGDEAELDGEDDGRLVGRAGEGVHVVLAAEPPEERESCGGRPPGQGKGGGLGARDSRVWFGYDTKVSSKEGRVAGFWAKSTFIIFGGDHRAGA